MCGVIKAFQKEATVSQGGGVTNQPFRLTLIDAKDSSLQHKDVYFVQGLPDE